MTVLTDRSGARREVLLRGMSDGTGGYDRKRASALLLALPFFPNAIREDQSGFPVHKEVHKCWV